MQRLDDLSNELRNIHNHEKKIMAEIKIICQMIAEEKADKAGKGIGFKVKRGDYTYQITRIQGDYSDYNYKFSGITWFGRKIKKDGTLGNQEHQLWFL